jgi:hypothetical protein
VSPELLRWMGSDGWEHYRPRSAFYVDDIRYTIWDDEGWCTPPMLKVLDDYNDHDDDDFFYGADAWCSLPPTEAELDEWVKCGTDDEDIPPPPQHHRAVPERSHHGLSHVRQ